MKRYSGTWVGTFWSFCPKADFPHFPAASSALAFIMIPMVLRTTEEVLVLVPSGYREAASALGIPRWKITYHIVLRTAFKGGINHRRFARFGPRGGGNRANSLYLRSTSSNIWNHSIKGAHCRAAHPDLLLCSFLFRPFLIKIVRLGPAPSF